MLSVRLSAHEGGPPCHHYHENIGPPPPPKLDLLKLTLESHPRVWNNAIHRAPHLGTGLRLKGLLVSIDRWLHQGGASLCPPSTGCQKVMLSVACLPRGIPHVTDYGVPRMLKLTLEPRHTQSPSTLGQAFELKGVLAGGSTTARPTGVS